MTRPLLALTALLWLAVPLYAQVSVITCNIPAVRLGSVDAADIDGDGDLDLVLTGLTGSDTPITRILRYDKKNFVSVPMSGIFSAAVYTNITAVIRPIYRGTALWADYDTDGDPDLLLSGYTLEEITTDSTVVRPITEIFANVGGTSFVPRGHPLPALFDTAADWGDYDGDGDLDLAIAGNTGTERLTRIFRNDLSTGGGLVDVGARPVGVSNGSLDWGDYDGDGDLDLLVTGQTGNESSITRILRNDDGVFTVRDVGLPSLLFADADWGDYDGDGDLDVLLSGGLLDPNLILGVTQIYRNDGGAFALVDLPLTGAFYGTSGWTDYDGDGDLDLYVIGLKSLGAEDREITHLYENQNGTFTAPPAVRLRGVHFGDGLFYDYDGNGSTDLLYTGLQINISEGRQSENLIVNLWEQRPPVPDPDLIVGPAQACTP